MLTDRFSPEQVAGRLKVEHPENPEMQVSHETIYQALYVQAADPCAWKLQRRCGPDGRVADRKGRRVLARNGSRRW
jgi:IS30 family transposase